MDSAAVGNNVVTHPSHYTNGKIECWDAMIDAFGKEAFMTYAKLNAFKYIWRSEHKNGIEDLRKAEFYLHKLIEVYDAE